MTTLNSIPHGAWVLVGDGGRILVLREEGRPGAPDLHILYKMDAPANPRTADQGSDQPGRTTSAVTPGRSAVEETDWHDQAERDFLRDAIATIGRWAEQDGPETVVMVAPPRALAMLREHMPRSLKPLVKAELARDYVHHPLSEIARLLAAG
ncbi:MAG: host attachment protein [Alsobacter sp.]